MAMKKNTPPWAGSKADKDQDKKTTKGMTPEQKKKFGMADEKMDAKNPSKKEDIKKDAALAKKIKAGDKKPMAKKPMAKKPAAKKR
jgi:hypothetical protein